MNAGVALRLGRVSNLPTVWSNVLAGLTLAGAAWGWPLAALVLLAMSLAYVGGMYLNDAFDADIDARERPERPIPSGRVARRTVHAAGFAMLAAAPALLFAAGHAPALAGLALAAAIVAYDMHHKANPLSPLLMGLCRVLVYAVAALAVAAALPAPLILGAAALLAWLIGLTYTAKRETPGRVDTMWPLALLALPVAYGVWLALAQPFALLFAVCLLAAGAGAVRLVTRRRAGDIPAAVGVMIAAISLFDAMLIAGAGQPVLAVVAAAGFPLTLALQRVVPGT